MADQSQVVRIHRKNPRLTAPQIAARLGCLPEYVRATGRRRGLTLAKALIRREPQPDSLIMLGLAARAAGLNVEQIAAIAQAKGGAA